MGWSGAGCSDGLLGTICFAATGAACCAVTHSAKKRTAASIGNTANCGIFLLFISRFLPKESANQSLLSGFLAGNFLDTRPEIFEHHYSGIAPRRAGHGTSWMRSSTRLIEAGNGHAMLRPSGHGTHGRRLRSALRTGVGAAVPKMRIHALEIERAFDEARENFVVGQIGSEAA